VNLVATRSQRVTCVSSASVTGSLKTGIAGGGTDRCKGGHAGARGLDLGIANGTWGFDLVASSARAVMKHGRETESGRVERLTRRWCMVQLIPRDSLVITQTNDTVSR
jgi:hypothetical protein